tara:strand:- start:1227 stop:2252 length:1026 start_codon:yes stop_codon:yes gene_type:complete
LDINLFDFDLPKKLIAQESIFPPDDSRLLIIKDDIFLDKKTMDFPSFLNEGDLLIVNNTKVIKSRITALINDKEYIFTFLNEYKTGVWKSLVKGSKKIIIGNILYLAGGLKGEVIKKNEIGEVFVKINLNKFNFINYLNNNGVLPLPPYIKDPTDNIHYQTLFAKSYGAVAAPTAGLHFTNNLKDKIIRKSIMIEEITLHVGLGTFLPIKVKNISNHEMYEEFIEIKKETANKINMVKLSGGRIIGVGTTVLRALESSIDEKGFIKPFKGKTNIFIKPGYNIQSIDYLFTNFHLPKSTLFILVCAFAGLERMQKAYSYAMNNNYRFYSLGDACLIKKSEVI